MRYVPLQTGRCEAGFEQCYAFWRPLLVITYFTAPQPARTGSKSACADDPPIVSNGSCQDLRPFQPLSCRHGIVDPVISPKQNGFLEDEGGHLPNFSIGTRAEPLPEGTRRSLSRGGAGGTDAEIGMQTTAEPFERLFRAFQGQHGLRFRHRRRNLFEKLHRPAPRGEHRLAPDFVILGRDDTANGFDDDEPGALLLDPGHPMCREGA